MLINLREHLRSVHRRSCSKGRILGLSYCERFLIGKIVFKRPFSSVSCLCMGKWELAEMGISILVVLVVTLKADVFFL